MENKPIFWLGKLQPLNVQHFSKRFLNNQLSKCHQFIDDTDVLIHHQILWTPDLRALLNVDKSMSLSLTLTHTHTHTHTLQMLHFNFILLTNRYKKTPPVTLLHIANMMIKSVSLFKFGYFAELLNIHTLIFSWKLLLCWAVAED